MLLLWPEALGPGLSCRGDLIGASSDVFVPVKAEQGTEYTERFFFCLFQINNQVFNVTSLPTVESESLPQSS